MKIRPLSNHLVVEPITETQTPGGILLPDSAQKKTGRGKVLEIGPGEMDREGFFPDSDRAVPRYPMDIKPGEVVVYGSYAGHEEEVDGRKVRILTEHDILGILEN